MKIRRNIFERLLDALSSLMDKLTSTYRMTFFILLFVTALAIGFVLRYFDFKQMLFITEQ